MTPLSKQTEWEKEWDKKASLLGLHHEECNGQLHHRRCAVIQIRTFITSLLLSQRQEIVKSLENLKEEKRDECANGGSLCHRSGCTSSIETLSEAISIITKGEGR